MNIISHIGPRCEECEDGYFGDPEGLRGPIRPCQKCNCNNNVDPNAIGNCDTTTGECLRCIDHTDGFNCERCSQGFFGDALSVKRPGDPPSCQPCQCYPLGTNIDDQTQLPICNGLTGDCSCKHHVDGRDCDVCEDGYFDITSDDVSLEIIVTFIYCLYTLLVKSFEFNENKYQQ